jgi:hypothetical protein
MVKVLNSSVFFGVSAKWCMVITSYLDTLFCFFHLISPTIFLFIKHLRGSGLSKKDRIVQWLV